MRCTFIEYYFGFVVYHMPLAGGPLRSDFLPPFLFVRFTYGLDTVLESILFIIFAIIGLC